MSSKNIWLWVLIVVAALIGIAVMMPADMWWPI